MAEDPVLRRIDRSLERIDRHMERGNALMERGNELIESNRQFMHEVLVRLDKSIDAMIAGLQQHTRELTEDLRSQRGVLEDLVDEARAQRAALFRVLERLGGGGQATGA